MDCPMEGWPLVVHHNHYCNSSINQTASRMLITMTFHQFSPALSMKLQFCIKVEKKGLTSPLPCGIPLYENFIIRSPGLCHNCRSRSGIIQTAALKRQCGPQGSAGIGNPSCLMRMKEGKKKSPSEIQQQTSRK